jgi:hypothetical protein
LSHQLDVTKEDRAILGHCSKNKEKISLVTHSCSNTKSAAQINTRELAKADAAAPNQWRRPK